MRIAIALLFALAASASSAQPAPAPEPPPLLPEGTPGTEIEPEVTIVERREGTFTEYRVSGALYMIKVQPRKGPAYYLIDFDGDGRLETRRNELDPDIVAPAWILLRW